MLLAAVHRTLRPPASVHILNHTPRPAAAGERPPQVGVFAMGPSALLSEAQLLCHDANTRAAAAARGGGPGGGGGGEPFLRYVRKTHNL